MDGSKRVTKVSKTRRYLDWSQHNRIRCSSSKEALAFEYKLRPTPRYVDNVKATKPSNRGRTLVKVLGAKVRQSKRRIQRLRWRAFR